MSRLTVPDYVHPDHGALGPDEGPRRVLMSPDLMVELAEAASGRRVTVDWGEPDTEGFYSPAITTHEEMAPIVRKMPRPHRLVAREDVEDGFVDPNDPTVTVLG